jgi:hypothetical protein
MKLKTKRIFKSLFFALLTIILIPLSISVIKTILYPIPLDKNIDWDIYEIPPWWATGIPFEIIPAPLLRIKIFSLLANITFWFLFYFSLLHRRETTKKKILKIIGFFLILAFLILIRLQLL